MSLTLKEEGDGKMEFSTNIQISNFKEFEKLLFHLTELLKSIKLKTIKQEGADIFIQITFDNKKVENTIKSLTAFET